MKAVLFDLDDTLYPEIEFVKSGFRAVACHLSARYKVNESTLVEQMYDILRSEGRGKIFNRLLQSLGKYTEERVRLLVYLYRSHKPRIQLYKDVPKILGRLRDEGIRLGIVTDGIASVQRNKIRVLGLDDICEITLCTDELGEGYAKPSTVPFHIALELLDVGSSEAVYVGDDIRKDFIGPNSIGMMTIQVCRKKDETLGGNDEHDSSIKAKHVVWSLKEIEYLITYI